MNVMSEKADHVKTIKTVHLFFVFVVFALSQCPMIKAAIGTPPRIVESITCHGEAAYMPTTYGTMYPRLLRLQDMAGWI